MENALFWLSTVLAVGVFVLIGLQRVLHTDADETEHPVADLPKN